MFFFRSIIPDDQFTPPALASTADPADPPDETQVCRLFGPVPVRYRHDGWRQRRDSPAITFPFIFVIFRRDPPRSAPPAR